MTKTTQPKKTVSEAIEVLLENEISIEVIDYLFELHKRGFITKEIIKENISDNDEFNRNELFTTSKTLYEHIKKLGHKQAIAALEITKILYETQQEEIGNYIPSFESGSTAT